MRTFKVPPCPGQAWKAWHYIGMMKPYRRPYPLSGALTTHHRVVAGPFTPSTKNISDQKKKKKSGEKGQSLITPVAPLSAVSNVKPIVVDRQ